MKDADCIKCKKVFAVKDLSKRKYCNTCLTIVRKANWQNNHYSVFGKLAKHTGKRKRLYETQL